jgi:hypothetical protein
VAGHLGCFHNLAIVTSAAINMGVQVPLEQTVSQSFGYIPKSGIAGSNGRSMFRFLRSLQIFFQSGCTSLHSHQQCIRVEHFLIQVILSFKKREKNFTNSKLYKTNWAIDLQLITSKQLAFKGQMYLYEIMWI